MPWRSLIAWLLVVPVAGWVVLRALGLERGYPMVPVIAYTPLAVVGAVAVAVVALLLRRRAPALVAAVLAVALAAFVAPRALGGPSGAEGRDGPRLTVLTANLYHDPRAAPGLVAMVRRERPDVVSLQEVTQEVAAALDAEGMRRLMPERLREVGRRGSATAVYAHLPLERGRAPAGEPMTAARLRLRGGTPVELLAVHPLAPQSERRTDAWHTDLRALPPASPRGAVRILAGDFNATLDHHEFRRLVDRGYHDAGEQAGIGLRMTWSEDSWLLPLVHIDHVLADRRIRVISARTVPIGGSDHRGVFTELLLPDADRGGG